MFIGMQIQYIFNKKKKRAGHQYGNTYQIYTIVW